MPFQLLMSIIHALLCLQVGVYKKVREKFHFLMHRNLDASFRAWLHYCADLRAKNNRGLEHFRKITQIKFLLAWAEKAAQMAEVGGAWLGLVETWGSFAFH